MLESGNVIIGNSSLRRYNTPQVENMSNLHIIMCGCEIFIFASMMQSELNAWRLKQI